jgi:hypothetical protein
MASAAWCGAVTICWALNTLVRHNEKEVVIETSTTARVFHTRHPTPQHSLTRCFYKKRSDRHIARSFWIRWPVPRNPRSNVTKELKGSALDLLFRGLKLHFILRFRSSDYHRNKGTSGRHTNPDTEGAPGWGSDARDRRPTMLMCQKETVVGLILNITPNGK